MSSPEPQRFRVLIVDDEAPMRSALRAVFEESGADAFEAGDVKKALSRIESEGPFDVLILDKNLPGESGIDLLRRLRDKGDDVCVLMMTAFPTAASIAETLNIRVDAYLEKPFPDIFEVVRIAREALARRRESSTRSASTPIAIRTVLPFPGPDESAAPLDWSTPLPAAVPTKASLLCVAACEEGEARALIAGPLEGNPIVFAGDAPAVTEALAAYRPDILIVDAASFEADLCRELTTFRRASPHAVCLVLARRPLAIPVLRALVDLGVNGLFEAVDYPAAVRQVALQLRRDR